VRIALAGLGTAAFRGHLPAINRLASEGKVTLAGAADPDASRRAGVDVLFPSARLFASAEAMLAVLPCDLLVVAAEPGAHAELVSMGLGRGLHVVCEKPLVLTQAAYDRVAGAHARRPDLGLVAVHQYRYSPAWVAMSRWLRLAARLHLPFSLVVDVSRTEVDPLAMSPWRADVERSGGILADHGVHYLSLAWTIDHRLDVLACARVKSAPGEHAMASVGVGSGVVTIQASTGSPTRHTSVSLNVANVDVRWCGESLYVAVGGRRLISRRVASLADRSHVDALYVQFYRELVRDLIRPAWRVRRTAEALVVTRALLDLLDRPWTQQQAAQGCTQAWCGPC
jgi:predicted dehydrogenase